MGCLQTVQILFSLNMLASVLRGPLFNPQLNRSICFPQLFFFSSNDLHACDDRCPPLLLIYANSLDTDHARQNTLMACADPKSFARGSPTLTKGFYEGREDPNSTKRGQSSARQRNAI